MRTFALASVALASCILNVSAINLIQRDSSSEPRVIRQSIRRRDVPHPIRRARNEILKRADVVEADLTNEQTLYLMDISIGTPAQDIKLHIDTGSSDLWVNTPESRLCKKNGCSDGTYNANASSSYDYLNSEFNITYVDGTGAVGDYVTDKVQFSGATLRNQEFGVGYTSSSADGVLGIGYAINEAAQKAGLKPYVNVPQHLVNSGYINTNAYSLWLDDLQASTGEIVFGGVNTDKYKGDLYTLPIIKTQGLVYAEFTIALTAVGVDGNDGSISKDISVGALLDSGSSLMYLPNNIAKAIFKEFNADYRAGEGLAFVDCSLANSDRTIDFTFSSPTISVPLSEIVLHEGADTCILGIGLSNGGTSVLGDTFIRSAYIVYDLQNNEISLAQTDFTSTTDNIVEIGSSGKLPSATVVPNAVTSVAAASAGAVNVGSISASGSANAARATGAIGYNMAFVGAAGAAAAWAF